MSRSVLVDSTDPLLRNYYPVVVAMVSLRFEQRLSYSRNEPTKTDDIEEPVGPPPPAFLPFMDEGERSATEYTISFIPEQSSIELPSHRQAGKFSLTARFEDLPVDPRVVKSASIVLSIGAIPPEDFAAGMQRVVPVGRKGSVLDIFNSAGVVRDDTLAMVGVVDDWEVQHDSSGSTVTASGRDMIGVLADAPFLGANVDKVDFTKDIETVVKSILQWHPWAATLVANVRCAPASAWPEGRKPTVTWVQQLPKNRVSVDGRPRKQGATTDMSFWDYITQVCNLVGAIPRVRGRFLEIIPSRGLFDQAVLETPWNEYAAPPFRTLDNLPTARRFSDGTELVIRQLAYGRDLESLSINRKLVGMKAQVIECVSYTPGAVGAAGRVVTARWPEEDDLPNYAGELVTASLGETHEQTDNGKKGKKKRPTDVQNVQRVPIQGITDPAQLKRIARAIFEETMRGEFTGSVVTYCLGSAGGGNADPDLLRLRPGDAITIGVAPENLRSLPASPVPAALRAMGGDPEDLVNELARKWSDTDPPSQAAINLARVLVAQQQKLVMELSDTFYAQNIRFTFGNDGVQIAFDFVNYYQAQLDAPLTNADDGRPRKARGPRKNISVDAGNLPWYSVEVNGRAGVGSDQTAWDWVQRRTTGPLEVEIEPTFMSSPSPGGGGGYVRPPR